MTDYQYFNKIKDLHLFEKSWYQIDFELANSIEEIILKNNSTLFNFQTLFISSDVEQKEILNPEITKSFSLSLGLIFIEKYQEGNICFANNPEIRPEFRQNFTAIDLLDYCCAVSYLLNNVLKINTDRIPVPNDSGLFWKLADVGQRFRIDEIKL